MKTKRTQLQVLTVACATTLAVATAVGILGARPLCAQAPTPTPSFDVADVHVRPHTSNPNPYMSGGVLRGGRYDLRNATMLDLITTAYGVDADTVLGGPNWLERDRFDVIAKAPQATTPETVKLMLQSLLADRFTLVLRKETKAVPGFALTLGTGKHKLKEAAGSTAPGCEGQPQSPAPGTIPLQIVSCHSVTMELLAQNLRDMAGAYVTSPVTDLTGLKGAWDFDLKWTARGLLAQAGSDGISLFDAIDKQLGLKLESRQVSTAVLTVDSVNQKPTDNPSGVAQSLPAPPPAEFDVADIKLSPPATNQMMRILPGGRLDLQGATLRMLINLAWEIVDDELLAGPKWLDETRFSVVARPSSAAIGGPATNVPQLDIDDVRQMLRALLVDRFKMKTHLEDRPVTAYTLVAAEPKLTKADPSNRTGCKDGPAPNSKDPRNSNPTLSRLVTCRNMTMAELAEDLQRIAPGYLHTPVADATGLDGHWDFTFNFSPIGALQQGGRSGDAGPAAAAPSASVPTGTLSLFDALEKQLGLKLEMHKRPMPVLVIDHADEKPTED